MDKLELYRQIIENFKSMSLKDALKKEHIGTHVFNSLIEMFPEETKKYYSIRDEKRRKPRPFAKKKFSGEEMQSMIDSYRNGIGLQELSIRFHTSPEVIKRNFIEYKIELRSQEELNEIQGRRKCPIKSNEKWEEVYKTYLKERSLSRACYVYGTSSETAIRNFKRLGLPLLKLDANIRYRTNFGIRYLYGSDWTDLFSYYETHGIKEVEEFFGIGRRRIYRIFSKLGYNRRSYEEEKNFVKNENGKESFKQVLESLKEYTILEDFKGYTRNGKYLKYTFRHEKCGRTFKRTLHDPSNIRCTHCYPKSRMETFIGTLLQETDVIQGDRSLISPQELDFYIPSKNVAFEYNGRYWHSELIVPKRYHEKKTEECLSKGVHLYHFWEGQDKEIIKSRINQILGKSDRIYARKLSLKFVNSKERKEFFNKTHMSGDVNCSFAVGLFNEDKLLSCVSFRKHKEGLEIARYSSELGISIVGGFSKLLKFAISYIKSQYQGVEKIVTYCNRDWTADYKDSVYYKNGFEFMGNTGPIMSYYNQNIGKTESREKYQKHKLKKLFPDYNGENVNFFLKSKGIVRLYNSGNWKFEKGIR